MRAVLILLLTASAFPCEEEPLFNGRDMGGWKMAGTGRFVVENGMLKTEEGTGLLYYSGRQFANGNIRVVFKTGDKSSHSAVIIRMSDPPVFDPGIGVSDGYAVQIGVGDQWHCTGAISLISRATACADLPAGEWNSMIISLEADHTTIYVNGQKVNEFVGDPRAPFRYQGYWGPGSMGLENHDTGSAVYFRAITFLNNFH